MFSQWCKFEGAFWNFYRFYRPTYTYMTDDRIFQYVNNLKVLSLESSWNEPILVEKVEKPLIGLLKMVILDNGENFEDIPLFQTYLQEQFQSMLQSLSTDNDWREARRLRLLIEDTIRLKNKNQQDRAKSGKASLRSAPLDYFFIETLVLLLLSLKMYRGTDEWKW